MRILILCTAALFTACGSAVVGQKTNPIDHKPPPDSRSSRPSDGMSVEGYTGTMDDMDVHEIMNQNMAGFNNCFSQASASYISGDVQLDFIVDPQGRVETVSIGNSTLGSWKVEDCMLQTARYFEFPPPRGNGRARFAFPFKWNAAGQRLTVSVDESWGYEALRTHEPVINACRSAHHFKDPFTLTIYVGRRGQVLSAGFHSKTPPSDGFPACVVQSLVDLMFPDPGQRIIKYRARVGVLQVGS